MPKRSFEPAVAETVIAHTLSIKGHLECQNDIWLDGTIDGNITAEGAVTIGVNGRVNGHIKAAVVLVSGHVKGNLTAKDNIELEASADITGDIKCTTLKVAEGASIDGAVSVRHHETQATEEEAPTHPA